MRKGRLLNIQTICGHIITEDSKFFIEPQIASNVLERCEKLEDLGRRTGLPISLPVKEKVVVKFKEMYAQRREDYQLSSFELSVLADSFFYSTKEIPSIIECPEETKFALNELGKSWKTRYFDLLIKSYIQHWGTRSKESLNLLYLFLVTKLPQQTVYNYHSDYLHPVNGPDRASIFLLKQNLSLLDLTKLLSLPKAFISSYYIFSGVLKYIKNYYYCNNSFVRFTKDIEYYLEATIGSMHQIDSAQKRKISILIATLVFKCNQLPIDQLEQRRIIHLAEKWVGNYQNKEVWKQVLPIHPDEKVPDIEAARKILERWANSIVLKAAFSRFEDPRRGEFWMQYVDAMDELVVRASWHRLKQIRDVYGVGQILNGFAIPDDQNTLLIVMRIGNTVITEVDVNGYAMYAYKADEVPAVKQISLRWVEKNRSVYTNLLAFRKGRNMDAFKSTGKLEHRDGVLKWETVFTAWLLRKVLPFGFR